ncbi:MAG: VC0807 family protein [Candidatus Dormibacteraceae bacterium]
MRTVIHLPSPRALAWHGGTHLLESALVPVGLFYVVLTILGFGDGVLAAMAWALAAITLRLLLRKKIPILLLATTAVLAARTAVGLATGSEFLYFLQPTLQNFALAFLLLLSTPLSRPVLARLAGDVCSFPKGLSEHPRMVRFFRQVSVLWATVFCLIGAGTLVLLLTVTVGKFLLFTSVGYYTLIGLAIVLSVLWFRRALRAEHIVLRLGPPQPVSVPAA